jgi:hypothetical protein
VLKLIIMIVTQEKEFSEVVRSLRNYKRLFLVGCGECAATAKTGGQEELERAKKALEAQGKVVTGFCIPSAPCMAPQVKAELAKNAKALRDSDAIVVFSCGLGVQSVKDNDRMGHAVIPALDSVCGAVMDANGAFIEKCSMCAECVLDTTAGICPVTLCPKGLLNGPCGGVSQGKCEVDKDKDCAWVLIYNELGKKNELDKMREIKKPRDFKKSTRPHRFPKTDSNKEKS